jgi:hypothetical protein
MTTFLRYAYLSLVAYAALAIILLLALAAHAEELKPSAEKQGRDASQEPKGKNAMPTPQKVTLARTKRRRAREAPRGDKGNRQSAGWRGCIRRSACARGSGCRSPAPDGFPPESPRPISLVFILLCRSGYRHSSGYHQRD